MFAQALNNAFSILLSQLPSPYIKDDLASVQISKEVSSGGGGV